MSALEAALAFDPDLDTQSEERLHVLTGPLPEETSAARSRMATLTAPATWQFPVVQLNDQRTVQNPRIVFQGVGHHHKESLKGLYQNANGGDEIRDPLHHAGRVLHALSALDPKEGGALVQAVRERIMTRRLTSPDAIEQTRKDVLDQMAPNWRILFS